MPVNSLLSKLDGVRRTGKGRWIAKCPAHDDGTPSLAITEAIDGRILLHDFGGCDTSAVLQSIGLTFGDLHPSPAHAHLPPIRRPFNAADALAALAFEATIVLQCANALNTGNPLSEHDRQRLLLSAARLTAAVGVIHG